MKEVTRSHGVTLVELLIVIAIIGVVAVVATPFLSNGDPQKLDAAASEFADAIRFARSESIRTGNPHGFYVWPAQNTIRVFRADMGTSPPTPVFDVYHPFHKQLYDIDLNTHPYARVDTITSGVIFEGTCNSPGHIMFDAAGVPYCRDPYPVLFRLGGISLKLGGHTRVLNLDAITGRLTVE